MNWQGSHISVRITDIGCQHYEKKYDGTAKDRHQRWALVKTVLNLGVPRNAGNLTSRTTISFSTGTPLHSININYKYHIMSIIWKVRVATKGESAGWRDKSATVHAILKQQERGLLANLGLNKPQSSKPATTSENTAPAESAAPGGQSTQYWTALWVLPELIPCF
jgi:hypothetical protein